jgi:hypothetical protein
MAFNIVTGEFISFAVYADVTARDQRFFEANEGITSGTVNDLLQQASARILSKVKATDWWTQYQFSRDTTLENDVRNVPVVDALKIKLREQDWKDLNIYFCMYEYLLPRATDFSIEADTTKINFYKDQFLTLFTELIEDGSWYDFDGDSTVEKTEKSPSINNRVRTR